MTKLQHHFESVRKKDPYWYNTYLYTKERWFITSGHTQIKKNKAEIEQRIKENGSKSTYEFSQARGYISGFALSIHNQFPHSESLWWLRQYYNFTLTHFKCHLLPEQSHALPIGDFEMTVPGRKMNSYIRPSDWFAAVMMALYWNDDKALNLLKNFNKSDIALDENSHFVSPFKYAEYEIVKQLLTPENGQLEAAIKNYMAIDLTIAHPGDTLKTIQHLDMPFMDCLLALFCHASEQEYKTKMLDALKKYKKIMGSAANKGDFQYQFPLNLIAVARAAYQSRGYLLDDHPYIPQWLLTCDLNNIQAPEPLFKEPESPTVARLREMKALEAAKNKKK